MLADNIPIDKLERWQKELQIMVKELSHLPREKYPSFYDEQINELLDNLQKSRRILAVISEGVEAETGKSVDKTHSDWR